MSTPNLAPTPKPAPKPRGKKAVVQDGEPVQPVAEVAPEPKPAPPAMPSRSQGPPVSAMRKHLADIHRANARVQCNELKNLTKKRLMEMVGEDFVKDWNDKYYRTAEASAAP